MPLKEWTDQQVEEIIGRLLIAGVLLAAVIVAGAGLLYLARHGAEPPHYRLFQGEPADLRSVRGAFDDALAGHSRGMIQVGLLLLIATPIARVVFSVFAFFRERDRLYVGITLVVLAVLLYSLFASHF
ncbi:MAG TPA: DUF1634 domain-containing protein [Chthonomonadaceae bacterium]|nr:DUF1634 domain-containing protein [Chthonomonadaceae bacterium]